MDAAVPNNPDAPSRRISDATMALDLAATRIAALAGSDETINVDAVREAIRNVKREHQLGIAPYLNQSGPAR